MNLPSIPRRIGPPLAIQMIAILVCALVGAQLVTLSLTVILPPSPTARWNIDDVVNALTHSELPQRLERRTMDGPPDVSAEGWLVSESSRTALAQRLGRGREDVVLAFYTQLPVGGVAVPASSRSPFAVNTDRKVESLSGLLIESAQAQSIPGGPPPGGAPSAGGMPGGTFPGGMPPGGAMPRAPGRPGNMPEGRLPSAPSGAGGTPPPGAPQQPSGPAGGALPAGLGVAPTGSAPPSAPVLSAPPIVHAGAPGMNALPQMPPVLNGAVSAATRPAPTHAPADDASVKAAPQAHVGTAASPQPQPQSTIATSPDARTPQSAIRPTNLVSSERPQPVPFRRIRTSLFDVASPPFIEGDFVAAARQPDGRWLAVAPAPEPFPNTWQKRVIIWFLLSLAVVSPFAWLFVRRIVVPLKDFAQAAEQLGRDPSATILPLSGPAEIGRAANAFNQMRNRLRAFVDDRTAMVGAISHDLRTPLTRLRFRLEDVPDEQRGGLLKEVIEMEQMISQVIAFIRDASTPGPRERHDFAELVADSVADARLVGADVEIEHNAHIPVEVDPVGIRRLLGNLLENAVKYGERARVRVSFSDDEAVAEILDAGPGIPKEEFDRAFEPFYRSEAARKSGQRGSGLGLAVCRSIARAHGGDVSFAHAREGFIARVSVPAAMGSSLRNAA